MSEQGPPPYPRATYRLQLNRAFGFDDARAIVPYLADLGISHLYASPFLKARPGSTHGYDITDHAQLNPEIGDAGAFDALIATLHAHGMGLILDFVPNHMGIGGNDNEWWLDVLEWGQRSPFAPFFDIDWQSSEAALSGKVLLPILGDHYGSVLTRGELTLRLDAERGTFSVWYFQHRLPIALRHYPQLLRAVAKELPAEAGEAASTLAALESAFAAIEQAAPTVQAQALARVQANELKQRLAHLVQHEPAVMAAVEAVLGQINGTPGEPSTFERLHRLLEEQSYRVAFWRVATHEINYRRFFDINELAGLRIEHPELFELTHRLVFQLFAEGKLQGLRIDHIDGLYDPRGYCQRLQDRAAYLLLQAAAPPIEPAAAPNSAPAGNVPRLPNPMYLVVEKILAPHERLRDDWPVAGTTGYEFMNLVNALFVDPAGERPLTDAYTRFTGRTSEFEEVVIEAKRLIIRSNLSSELTVIANLLNRLAKESWDTRDYTLTGLREALVDVISHFPVYRTYVTEAGASEEDRRDLEWALARARRTSPNPDRSIYDFIQSVLSTELARRTEDAARRDEIVRIAMKFQQLTSPVMAKAFEDTALYRFVRLLSLNEVGGDPSRFGLPVSAFHRANQERLQRHPFNMLATATHDHKRGEDARARLNVLSERPREWSRRVQRWSRANRTRRGELDGRPVPGLNDEYLFYQALIGAWPYELTPPDFPGIEDFTERMALHMLKASREAKQRTSWTAPNAEYEALLDRFVRTVLNPANSRHFLDDFLEFLGQIAPAGAVNGLAQTLLKLTAPGVPDIYQGSEFWDLSLVDPDNRRPVDYESRRAPAAGPPSPALAAELVRGWRDGRIKQHLIRCALGLRRRKPALFAAGEYQPLDAGGAHAERIIAFARHGAEGTVVTIVPRLVAGMLGGLELPLPPAEAWADTQVSCPPSAAGALRSALTGVTLTPQNGAIMVADALADLPVALLVSETAA
ncbi:MAG: malto-oligosyltrehalose synthase [Rhodospirillaceae bacterium]|nr:malto-oligosyltrehalose synthase [Rhodospirillaceae bacterium]